MLAEATVSWRMPSRPLLRVERVASVDIGDRFLDRRGIEQRQMFHGARLPFADASFDCLLLCNVLHHVPTASRVALLKECRRVSKSGIVYVKDDCPALSARSTTYA